MKKLYCVYDKVASVYNPPFVAENDSAAKRAFDNAMSKNPFANDMSLYALGEFNDDTDGSIAAIKPEFVCNFVEKVG